MCVCIYVSKIAKIKKIKYKKDDIKHWGSIQWTDKLSEMPPCCYKVSLCPVYT